MCKVLLYSGGTDSWLIDQIWKADKKIYINIHGFYSQDEINKLPKDVEIIDFPFLGLIENRETNFVPLRNLYFLMIASNYGDEICYGATLSDRGSKDKRIEFIEKAEEIINYGLNGNSFAPDKKVTIVKDFVKLHKFELIQKYLDNGGTIEKFVEESFSCYHSKNGKECMDCKQCYKKFLEAYYFGYQYSKDDKKNMMYYLIDAVIPLDNHEGTYFTERAGEGIFMQTAVENLFKEFGLDWRNYQ